MKLNEQNPDEIISRMEADNDRLLRGIKRILDYLEQSRDGDAMFDCEALLAGSKYERKFSPLDGT